MVSFVLRIDLWMRMAMLLLLALVLVLSWFNAGKPEWF